MPRASIIGVTGLAKRFGSNWALRDVSLTVRPGEIHGLLGQNGSGKSTLIKVLAGFHTPDAGTLTIRGRTVPMPLSGGDIRDGRLRFVHQDLALVPSLSVAENFDLERLAARSALSLVRDRTRDREVEQLLSSWGVEVSARAPVESMSRLDRAKLAIVRAVAGLDGQEEGSLLVLDEPTAFLPPDAAAALFQTMREVASRSAGVLFVTHNLEEVMQHTDRATVLRDGRLIETVDVSTTAVPDIVEMILGHGLGLAGKVATAGIETAPVVARVSDLRADGLGPVDLTVRRGEVVGITGLIGSGFERVAGLVFGSERPRSGSLVLDHDVIELSSNSPRRSVKNHVGMVPADRLTNATAPTLTVAENVTAGVTSELSGRLGLLTARAVRRRSSDLTAPMDVRPADPDLPLQSLSGGNQQKVVIAKWQSIDPRMLLISEPTQGVDIGAREQIAGVLRSIAASGCAVLCASSDLDQLTELCTRVLVFRRGRMVAEVAGPQLSKHNLMLALFDNTTPGDSPPSAAPPTEDDHDAEH